MQNCHRQLKKHWSIALVGLFFPLLLAGAIPILPTFDDWTSLVSPSQEPFFTKERFLFFGYHWRPFDSIFGYIVGRNPQLLFPLLNHICVVIGHVGGTILLYQILLKLDFGKTSRNLATLFFFLSSGMLATVLAVDGLNQTYANLWALASALAYLSLRGQKKYVFWLVFVAIGTLCKENALMWAIIVPILAFGFDKIDFQTCRKDLFIGFVLMLLYAAAIFILPKNIEIHPEYVPEGSKIVTSFFKFLLTTWVAVDFAALLHAPSRNIFFASVTILLSLPLLYFLFIKNYSIFKQKSLIYIVFCLFIAVAPHLFTVFSMMHTYAGLALAAMIIGTIIDQTKHRKWLKIVFISYFAAAIFVDVHLWWKSYQSGLIGREMAREIIVKTAQPPKNAFLIIIEDDYPRLSSFCVVPSDALGWGRAVQFETDYEWPKMVNDTTIQRNAMAQKTAQELARRQLDSQQFDAVWIINHRNIEVLP
ncbi:MAG: hypothetical protein SPL55_00290 [Prevotella sp.]|nr:hypothetical protein [Prevotella sp.]